MSRMGQLTFDLLPDYVREADTDGHLLGYVSAIGSAADTVAQFVSDADPDTSRTGTCEPVNPATTPAGWLRWLGWLSGIPVEDLGTSDARWYLSRVGAQAHGSPGGMELAVGATLSEPRTCIVNTHVGGDPWVMEVVVSSDCLVDSAVTYRAAMREKPAGVSLSVLSSDPMTYDDLKAAYTDYADMKASGLTYRELRFS